MEKLYCFLLFTFIILNQHSYAGGLQCVPISENQSQDSNICQLSEGWEYTNGLTENKELRNIITDLNNLAMGMSDDQVQKCGLSKESIAKSFFGSQSILEPLAQIKNDALNKFQDGSYYDILKSVDYNQLHQLQSKYDEKEELEINIYTSIDNDITPLWEENGQVFKPSIVDIMLECEEQEDKNKCANDFIKKNQENQELLRESIQISRKQSGRIINAFKLESLKVNALNDAYDVLNSVISNDNPRCKLVEKARSTLSNIGSVITSFISANPYIQIGANFLGQTLVKLFSKSSVNLTEDELHQRELYLCQYEMLIKKTRKKASNLRNKTYNVANYPASSNDLVQNICVNCDNQLIKLLSLSAGEVTAKQTLQDFNRVRQSLFNKFSYENYQQELSQKLENNASESSIKLTHRTHLKNLFSNSTQKYTVFNLLNEIQKPAYKRFTQRNPYLQHCKDALEGNPIEVTDDQYYDQETGVNRNPFKQNEFPKLTGLSQVTNNQLYSRIEESPQEEITDTKKCFLPQTYNQISQKIKQEINDGLTLKKMELCEDDNIKAYDPKTPYQAPKEDMDIRLKQANQEDKELGSIIGAHKKMIINAMNDLTKSYEEKIDFVGNKSNQKKNSSLIKEHECLKHNLKIKMKYLCQNTLSTLSYSNNEDAGHNFLSADPISSKLTSSYCSKNQAPKVQVQSKEEIKAFDKRFIQAFNLE